MYQKGRPEVAFDPSRGFCPTFRPEACRGPHLYQKGRPELAFDPSRRICSAFRPATRQEVKLECVDVLDLIVIPSASTQTS